MGRALAVLALSAAARVAAADADDLMTDASDDATDMFAVTVVAGTASALIFFVCCVVPLGYYLLFAIQKISKIGFPAVSFRFMPPEDTETPTADVVLAEVLLSTLYPFLAAGVVLALGSDWPQYLVVVPVFVRAFLFDARMTKVWLLRHAEGSQPDPEREQFLGGAKSEAGVSTFTLVWRLIKEDFAEHLCSGCPRIPSLPYIQSKGELMDAISDGIAIVVTYQMQRDIAEFDKRLQLSAEARPLGILFGPLVQALGLWGLMLVSLLIANFIQIAVVVATGGNDALQVSIGASSIGYGALLMATEPAIAQEDDMTYRFLAAFGRTVFEATPQFALQTSCILAGGEGLLGRPWLLFSTGLTLAQSLWKTVELVRNGSAFARHEGFSIVTRALMMAIIAVVPFYVVSTAIRLGFSETCESKIYMFHSMACLEIE